MTNSLFALGTIIIAASAFLQGLSSFGFSILSLPLLSIYLPPKVVVPMLLFYSIIINLTVIASCWKSFSIKYIWILLCGAVLGLPLGTYLLLILDDHSLRKGIGVFVVVLSLILLSGKRWKMKREKTSQLIIGFFSGILSGSVGISGPPIILFLSNKGVSKDEFRANLSGYFFLLNLFTIPVYYLNGLLTKEVLHYSLNWAPALIAGVAAGTFFARKIKPEKFGRLVLILLLLTGLLSLFK
ncbi:MAG: sulfite exporter TauE/SafE family protein [Candidatus Cloacimonetes bacterium]|nr:sulfite exporter TauE/SafE family protein [Candidatus Cloacimonadota bacterium]